MLVTADFDPIEGWSELNPNSFRQSSISLQTSDETKSVFFSTNWSYFSEKKNLISINAGIIILILDYIQIYRRIARIFRKVTNNEAILKRFLWIGSFHYWQAENRLTRTRFNNHIHVILDWWISFFRLVFQ